MCWKTLKPTLLISENMKDTMGNQQETNIGYLAGIIDGEGSIGLEKMFPKKCWQGRRKKVFYSPRIQIVNTDPAIIVKVRDTLKLYDIGYYIMENKRGTYQTLFMIRVDKTSYIKTLLELVLSNLVGNKKAKGELLLEYVNSRISRGAKLGTNQVSNISYSDREMHIADILDEWTPRDHTLPAEVLRRYDPNSGRKPESIAEMTMPTA